MAADKGYTTLQGDLKSETLRNLYIFYGEERYLKNANLDKVREALVEPSFEEFNYHRIAGKGLSVEDLTEVVEAMPMMAQHTLVVVEDWDIFKLDERGRTAFIAMMETFPEYCTLVLLYEAVEYKRDKKMKKLCAALDEYVVEVAFQQQERGALVNWLRRRFKALGHDIDGPAADHLLFTCGTLMGDLVPEIEKIGAFAKGEMITIDDINAVAAPILDAKIFDITNAVTAGDFDKAATVLSELLRMQTEPVAILATLGKELRRLYTARIALDQGKDRFWLKDLWRMTSDYPAKLLLQAARRVSRRWCSDALRRAQTLDRRMKSEKGINAESELKAFLMELAGGR